VAVKEREIKMLDVIFNIWWILVKITIGFLYFSIGGYLLYLIWELR
jgi:hypothetical protein